MTSSATPARAGVRPTAPGPEREMPPERRRSRKEVLIEWGSVTLGFFALATVLTWPLLIRMSSGFYGFGNDNWGGIWQADWISKATWGPESLDFSPAVSFPQGFDLDYRFVAPYDRVFAVVFGDIGDGLFSYNIQIFLSFVAAGVTMYALARYLTGSRPAAVIAGVVFTASPFHLAMGMQYHAMSSIQWCPLLVLAVIVALRTRRLRDAALAGAAFALVWITSYYYGWFAIWFLIAFLLAVAARGLWRGLRRHEIGAALRSAVRFAITRGSLAVGAFLAIVIPLLLPLISEVTSKPEEYSRSAEDFAFTAVRPWQYILPAHDHPVFDSLTADVINRHAGILPVYEQAVYLGLVPVLLALVALVFLRRSPGPARYAAPALVVGGFISALLTLGPDIPFNVFSIGDWLSPSTNAHFTNISQFVFDISASFRYYGRAFVYTSVVLAALAGVGYAILSIRLSRLRWWAPALGAGVVCLLVLFEFANRPPERFVDLRTPPWVETVADLPEDAALIDYPAAGYSTPRSLYYIFWQTRHDRTTVNPGEDPETDELIRSVEDPNSYISGQILHDKGIDFAVVHTKLPDPTFPPYQPAVPNDAMPRDAGAKNPWFEPYRRTSDTVVYKVRKKPIRRVSAVAGFGPGFGNLEIDETGRWRWLMRDSGSFNVVLAGARPARVRLRATSFHEPRKVEFLVDGDRKLTRTLKPGVITVFEVPLNRRAGTQQVELRATPGARQVSQVLNTNDLRSLSVRLQTPELIVRGER